MKTSYFGNPKLKLFKDETLVSISMRPPKFILDRNIRIYKPLCPSWNLVSNYKEKRISEEEYIKRYYTEHLIKLNPQQVFEDIGKDSIILCYEKSGDFCHRQLVAKWLSKNLFIEITEL